MTELNTLPKVNCYLLIVLACSACHQGVPRSGLRAPAGEFVPIGYVRSVAVVHSGELPRLLEANGIDAGFEGSLSYGLFVREGQVSRAKEVLRTNHLVLEGKVVLNPP